MLALALVLTLLLLAVMVFDATRYIIPNWLVGVLVLLYPTLWIVSPMALVWWPNILGGPVIALAMFAVGYLLFVLRSMGGGDVKLLAVLGLWTGTVAALEFLIYTAILGGVLSVVLYFTRPVFVWYDAQRVKAGKPAIAIPKIFTVGEPVPYGIAIAGAFLWLLWHGCIPGLGLVE